MIAVVMCGGMGTRMRPITDIVPKPLLKVGGREIIDVLIEKLTQAGVDTIYLTLGYMGDEIRKFVDQRNYNAEIIPVFENSPLGTAGGVRNAIGDTLEDIIVLSGDNIFNFDLKKAYHAHLQAEADVSLIGIASDDPRNYGTVQFLPDGTITEFIEKPSWSQADSNIINTGIYFLKGEILSLIPTGKMYDFANDLFPRLMMQNYKLFCILSDGKWGDLGDIRSYLEVNREVLKGIYGSVCNESELITDNQLLNNGSVVIAPCVISKRSSIGSDCIIGPYSIIGSDCVISDGCTIRNSIIDNDCVLDYGIVCNGSFIGENCQLGAYVRTEDNSVLAGSVNVRQYAVISDGSKVNAGCIIDENQIVNGDFIRNRENSASITAHGMRGVPMKDIFPQQAVNAGCAIASCKNISRVGIADDGAVASVMFKNAIAIGLQACNATVYDFGEIIRSQRVFFTQYCKLDFFVSVTLLNDEIIISFTGKNGSPVCRKTEREIQAACRYAQFKYSKPQDCKHLFMMNPMTAVYRSLLMHKLPPAEINEVIAVECDNLMIYEMMNDIIRTKGYRCNYGGLLFMIDKYGEKFYAVENERAYSHDRILTVCCNYELENGADIAVGEAAPGILELLTQRYGRNMTRIYEAENEMTDPQLQLIADNPWIYDGLMCIVQLLAIMQKTKKTLQQLSDALPDCYVKTMSFVYNGEPKNFKDRLLKNGAVRSQIRTGYYEWEDERGSVKVKADSACKNVKVLIESESIEMSRELAADAEVKLKNCAIDKF